jgi:UDP-4-amino-4,6-dideoxy-N-acetyl-beta-L-altrosamine N-acetyltransferase
MLRPARDADRDVVLRWRNHPDVRAVSLTQHEITPQEHTAWWERTLVDPSSRVLIYERRDVPSGVVTFFDLDETTATGWWGYYLDAVGLGASGQLLMAWIEIQREAIRYAFDELGLTTLQGEVFASNEAVRQLNRRHRFTELETYQRDVDGTPTDVIRVQLRAQDRPSRRSTGKSGTP